MDLHQSKYTGEEIEAMFDKVSGAKVATGTFEVGSYEVNIDVGFEPDLVIIYNETNNNTGIATATGTPAPNTIPRILTKSFQNNDSGYITSTGFTCKGSNTYTYVYYIAIKF
mgnify:CR=1 FL=1